MTHAEIVLLALALAADAFAVGAVIGLRHRQPRQFFRLSFHFGLFQALMPLLGILLGGLLSQFTNVDHWISMGLLVLIGLRMIAETLRGTEPDEAIDYTRGLRLIGLSLAVSIDAFAVGITLGAARAPLAFSVTAIGIVAALATLLSMLAAGRVPLRFRRWSGLAGGLVLIALGVKIVLEHEGVIAW